MSAADIAINIAAQFTGKNAFQKADTATAKLQKSVKNLGRSLGLALGTAAIVNFGKQSVKAFAADDNAARSLAKTLENLGLNTRYAGSELNGYISRLEQQTGVLDDELRPAMDRMLRATNNLTKSQELLGLALDISAGTGKSLTQVSQGLQKAYLGNNASLGRLGVGLTKAELSTGSFVDIQEKLTTLFSGQAKDAADSFQGSLNKLTVASNNAKEAIGKGLVDSLMILGGGGSMNGAIGAIDKMAKSIADSTKNVAYMIKQFEALKPVIITIGALLLLYFAPVVAAVAAIGALLAIGGKNLQKAQYAKGIMPNAMGRGSQPMSISGQTENSAGRKARLKAEKDGTIIQKTANELLKISNKDTKEKLELTAGEKALAELKKMFDLEGIQIQAALNGTISEEDRLRLNGLKAINDSDTSMALLALNALNAAKASKDLADAQTASLAAWGQWQTVIGNAFGAAAAISNTSGSAVIPVPSIDTGSYAPGDIPGGLDPNVGMGGWTASSQRPTINVTVNNAGSVTTERDLVSAITQGIYNNQASGVPINYTTQY